MSIAIYYEARRPRPLTTQEAQAIRAVERRYAVEDQIEHYAATGQGPNWESFCVYDSAEPSAPSVVFEGATRLPDNSEEHCLTGLKHWCAALSEIRRLLADAEWHVHIDDVSIPWNEQDEQWDPWSARD